MSQPADSRRTLDELLDKARQGDKSAEDQLLRYLRVRFVLLAKRRIGEEYAEDLAQEACVTVLQKYRDVPPAGAFEPWAYGVLRNKIGNYLQSSAVRRETDLRNGRMNGLVGRSSVASDPVLKLRLLDCVRKIVKQYPRYARVLNLVYQGYSTTEICRRLKVSPGHCYVLLNRGRKMLSKCLEAEGNK